jgi:hypothetical protein
MAGFKLMSDFMNHLYKSNFIQNLNQGLGTPKYLEGKTIQTLVDPMANMNNPMLSTNKEPNTFMADNTIAQSNYLNPRRMKS